MNTLIISTFSCTFEEFKNDVTTLFLEEMCKEFVTDYEFVKMLDTEWAREWDKANNCRDIVYKLELVE